MRMRFRLAPAILFAACVAGGLNARAAVTLADGRVLENARFISVETDEVVLEREGVRLTLARDRVEAPDAGWLQAAQDAAEAGDGETARSLAEQYLLWHPEDAAARAVLERAEAAEEEVRIAEKNAARAEALVAKALGLAAERRLDDAQAACREALAAVPGHEDARDLLHALTVRRDALRRADVQLAKAREALEAEQLEEAQAALEKLRELQAHETERAELQRRLEGMRRMRGARRAAQVRTEGAGATESETAGGLDREAGAQPVRTVQADLTVERLPAPPARAPVALFPVRNPGLKITMDGRAENVDEAWGYMDGSGNPALAFQYQTAGDFIGGFAVVGLSGFGASGSSAEQVKGFIDAQGETVYEYRGLAFAMFHEDRAVLGLYEGKRLNRAVIVDAAGRTIFEGDGVRLGWLEGRPATPEAGVRGEMGAFFEDFAAVRVNGKWGFINREGAFRMPPQFAGADVFSEALAPVDFASEALGDAGALRIGPLRPRGGNPAGRGENRGRWGYVDVEGKVAIEPGFDVARPFSEGLAAVWIDGAWGYVDKAGRQAIPPAYDYAWPFREGLAAVRPAASGATGPVGFIDKTGAMRIPAEFHLIDGQDGFVDGLAAVKNEAGLAGLIDTSGAFVVGPAFQSLGAFSSEGLAVAQTEDGFGYIDREGRWAVAPEYLRAFPFLKGLARVLAKPGLGSGTPKPLWIDTEGKTVWPK